VHGHDGVEIDVVVSNRADAQGLERARAASVETAVFDAGDHPSRSARDRALAAFLQDRGIRLVVLAGYMQLLDAAFLAVFPQAVINVHPALLPAFPGPHPIEDQIAYGVKVSGVTVHFVDDGVDTGPIILQEAVTLPYTRDDKEILTVLHRTEHQLLPRAVRLIAKGAVSMDAENPRLVRVDETALESDG
jgi:phosphoribosylglycinamide formyltransferase 1